MKRPVVIVDPLSSGIELAPAFKARGIPAIAVTFKSDWIGFGMKIQTSDFVKIIPDQSNIVDILRRYNPIAISTWYGRKCSPGGKPNCNLNTSVYQ